MPCCWPTPSTIRPRRCCWAWAGVRGPLHRRHARRRPALVPPLLGYAAARRTRRAPNSGSRPGTIRTTTTAASPGCGCAARCCRCSRTCWAAGWLRRWRAPPPRCGKTPRRSTRSRSTRWPPRGGEVLSVAALEPLPATVRRQGSSAAGCSPAARAGSATSRSGRSTRWSPRGAARGGRPSGPISGTAGCSPRAATAHWCSTSRPCGWSTGPRMARCGRVGARPVSRGHQVGPAVPRSDPGAHG